MHRVHLRPQTVVFALAVLLVTLAIAEGVARFETGRAFHRQRALVTAQADAVRARLEAQINGTHYLIRNLAAYVAGHPRLAAPEFERIADELLRDGAHVKDVSLARDNVVSFVHPRQGNEALLGLRYMEIPEQRAAVQRVMASGGSLLAGPVQLAKGGRAFVSRTPVLTLQKGAPRYWGLLTVTLDANAILDAAGIHAHAETRFLLRGKDGKGAAGAAFHGQEALLNAIPVLMPVIVPGGEWQLAAVPTHGWANGREVVNAYRLTGFSLAVLFSALVAVLLFERERSDDLALHDPLTELPNRLFFDLRLEHEVERAQRHRQSFALLYVDLDDFKPVNDLFGHKAGDRVLVETGHRLRASLRRMDTVARIGGDEFMVIVSDVNDHQEAVKVAGKLIETLRKPITVPGGTVAVGATVGISFYPANGTTTDALIREADRAMYTAKRQGKNRCVTA